MDDLQPLHPNLQKLAAAYRQLHQRWASGAMDATETRQRIAALVARDDQGVQWRLDPNTGEWERQLHDGSWQQASPPTYGLPTLSAADVSTSGTEEDVADEQVALYAVDEHALLPPGDVVGATRRAQLEQHEIAGARPESTRWRWMEWLAATATVTAALWLLL